MNNMLTPEITVQKMCDGLDKKYGLLQEIHKLTIHQSKCIDDEQLEDLQKLIDQKQNIINQINELDAEFNTLFEDLKIKINVKSLDEVKYQNIKGMAELRDKTSKVIEELRQISEVEKQNSIKVKNLMNSLEKEIKKMNDGKRVISAYNKPNLQTSSYFIDKKK